MPPHPRCKPRPLLEQPRVNLSGDPTEGEAEHRGASMSRPITFAERHIGPSDDERARMLSTLGLASLDELVDRVVPKGIRQDEALRLPPAATETEVLAELRALADRNVVRTSMIGLGYHDTI